MRLLSWIVLSRLHNPACWIKKPPAAVSASLFCFAFSSVVARVWEAPIVEGASLQGCSFLEGTHALPHVLPGPEHLPENSPPVSKVQHCQIETATVRCRNGLNQCSQIKTSTQPLHEFVTSACWSFLQGSEIAGGICLSLHFHNASLDLLCMSALPLWGSLGCLSIIHGKKIPFPTLTVSRVTRVKQHLCHSKTEPLCVAVLCLHPSTPVSRRSPCPWMCQTQDLALRADSPYITSGKT